MKETKLTEKLPGVRKDYKDTIFRRLFSEKESLLSLYNAVSGSDYENPDELEIVTLDNAVYMNMRNDLAFVIDYSLHLYEHQSTYNPNMPLRNLFLCGKGAFYVGRCEYSLPQKPRKDSDTQIHRVLQWNRESAGRKIFASVRCI